ncbi:MAG TPA: arsenate reductase ArsC [Limnochordia bacterium]|nr:arsenate reductase ArsC [Limnochordia bacterium]
MCTANSCRSQMAEGWARALHSETIEAVSAGTKPSRVNPLAIAVMQEVGVDISTQRAKGVDAFLEQEFDYVITLCGDANETCPIFAGAAKRVHAGFPDPAQATGSPDEVKQAFRNVRDQIRAFVAGMPGSIEIYAAREGHN